MDKKMEVGLLAGLFLVVLFIWTLPLQNNSAPFGDVDASTHFALSDSMFASNLPLYTLPFQLNASYSFANAGKIWYPPQFHLNGALLQLFSGSRFLPFFLLMALLSSSIVFISYFVFRRLFNVYVAFLASVLLAFSTRDFQSFLFAQWPQQIAYFFIPVIVYLYYRYTEGLLAKENKSIYLYIMALLLAVQFFFHPQGVIHSALFLMVYSVALWVKERKFFFRVKEVIISLVIFVVFILAFIQFPLAQIGSEDVGNGAGLSRLFEWYPDGARFAESYPQSFYTYRDNHALWTLPLLFVGILYLVFRLKDHKSILLLSWLLSFYLVMHLDMFGFSRIHRSLSAEAHIFAPLIAIGLYYLPSFFKVNKQVKNLSRIVLIVVFLVLAVFINGKQAYSSLDGAYSGVSRLTTSQIAFSDWAQVNLPEDQSIYDMGTLTLAKVKWMRQVARRPIFYFPQEYDSTALGEHYLLFDYSDIVAIGNQQAIAQLQEAEQAFSALQPIYNQNNMRLYNIGEN